MYMSKKEKQLLAVAGGTGLGLFGASFAGAVYVVPTVVQDAADLAVEQIGVIGGVLIVIGLAFMAYKLLKRQAS